MVTLGYEVSNFKAFLFWVTKRTIIPFHLLIRPGIYQISHPFGMLLTDGTLLFCLYTIIVVEDNHLLQLLLEQTLLSCNWDDFAPRLFYSPSPVGIIVCSQFTIRSQGISFITPYAAKICLENPS